MNTKNNPFSVGDLVEISDPPSKPAEAWAGIWKVVGNNHPNICKISQDDRTTFVFARKLRLVYAA